ncbi:SOUL heme-binding family protein [Quillaja saponaria]|uniref:SOUL heme-binding family protein n=1 Tax=Quillaja saponaria TaxID=32244 RepID=A0AAD7LEF5_QUISA|nr:SOUL heme-binding family protein [Quillaja saponaria]
MACSQTFRPLPAVCLSSRRLNLTKSFIPFSITPLRILKCRKLTLKTSSSFKWAINLSLVDQSPQKTTTVDVERLVGFLYDDLPHLFDDQGIDRTAYDERVSFRDPITKHDTLSGYLFNIALLKTVFRPEFLLHWVKQTGPYEITTRWTMVMKFMLLPWKPELVFTGTSVMGINPENGKFCSHVDIWDSIKKNDYFSFEGFLDVIKQLRIYKTPELESPKYQILKRTANYEVRQYAPFVVVETTGDKLSGSTGFNDVAGYIFGKNSTMEKIPMTTPVFTQSLDAYMSRISIQIVLPLEKDLNSLPSPNQDTISLRKVEGGVMAAVRFSGKPTEDIVHEKEKALRSNLLKDGLKPKAGCLFARYNDPGRTWSFIMRNEVLIGLQDFALD